MQYALTCKDLWCYVNTNPDPMDILGILSFMPIPINLLNITAAEQTLIYECLLNDIKAKDLITQHVSQFIRLLVLQSYTVTSRHWWNTLTAQIPVSNISFINNLISYV